MDHLHSIDTNDLMQVPNMNIGTNTMKIDELQQTQPMIKPTPFPFIAGLSSLNSLDKSQTLAGLQSMPPIIATDSNNNNNMLNPQKFNINSINTMNTASMSSMGSIIPTNTIFSNGLNHQRQRGAMSMSRRRHHGLNQAIPNSQFAPFQPLPPSLMPDQGQNQAQNQQEIIIQQHHQLSNQQPQSVYIRDGSPNTDSTNTTNDGVATENSISSATKRYNGDIKLDFNVTDFSANTKREIVMDFNVTNFAANASVTSPSTTSSPLNDTKLNVNSTSKSNNNDNALNNKYQAPTITLMATSSNSTSNSNTNTNSNVGMNGYQLNNLDLRLSELQFPSLLPNFPDLAAPIFGDITNDNMDDNIMNMDLNNDNNDALIMNGGDDDPDIIYHQCPSCPRKFQHRSNLTIHQKIHSSSAFICNFCGKKFARHSNLRQHTRVHTNERPFKCKYCPKSFKQQHSLIDHVRIHTGEKPHKCEFCEKAFAARCNLIVHRRIHTGERPYKCDVCHKQYASKSGYNSHRKKYHPDGP